MSDLKDGLMIMSVILFAVSGVMTIIMLGQCAFNNIELVDDYARQQLELEEQ